jgi:UDP:flavonoid glycosyltransferase YjiC (YdhE family)
MRVVCTCLPGYGHFIPIVPLASALVDNGHEVVIATAHDFCPQIEQAGFDTFPAGLSLQAQLERANASIPEGALPHGKERFTTFVPKMLAGVAAPPRAADLGALLRTWQPDLLLHDETELGGPVAAAAAGIPWATHSVGILRPLSMLRTAGETLAPLAAEWGIDIETLGPFAGLFRYLYLDVCPPDLQSGEITQVEVAHPLRGVDLDAAAGPADAAQLPAGLDDLDPGHPTVYLSLGTIFNSDPGIFRTVLAGLAEEPVNVIVTLGPDADPAVLGPQPANVHVAGFIPQDLLLPRCDAVINQGGTAILSILAHGLPLLVLPRGANQFHNAEACVAAGVGRALLPGEVDPASVRREVRLLLDEPGYRERAGRIAGQIAEMPDSKHGVTLLERLAREAVPMVQPR